VRDLKLRAIAAGARRRLQRLRASVELALGRTTVAPGQRQRDAIVVAERAGHLAQHPPVDVRIDLFRAAIQPPDVLVTPSRELGWAGRALRGVVVHDEPGDHQGLLNEPVLADVAQRLRTLLHAAKLAQL
jgi:thioesterase domain-containing protein